MAMKFRRTALVAGLLAGLGFTMIAAAAPAAAAQGVNARQDRQHARIAHGVRTGKLTPHEARRLQRKHARIAAQERRMRWRHGGYLARRDRAVLNKRLDRASAEIYRKKHNRRHW